MRAANAIQGLQDEPDDDATEIISDAAFDQAIPPQGNPDVISKKEFLAWAGRALRGIDTAEQFVAAFSCGITPGIDNEETDLAAAKLQARIRGRNERLNPTAPPAKTAAEPAPEEPSPEEPAPEEPSPAPEAADELPEAGEETDAAAAKLQARIRGRNERLNPTTPPAKTNAALVETPEADPPVEQPSSAAAVASASPGAGRRPLRSRERLRPRPPAAADRLRRRSRSRPRRRRSARPRSRPPEEPSPGRRLPSRRLEDRRSPEAAARRRGKRRAAGALKSNLKSLLVCEYARQLARAKLLCSYYEPSPIQSCQNSGLSRGFTQPRLGKPASRQEGPSQRKLGAAARARCAATRGAQSRGGVARDRAFSRCRR